MALVIMREHGVYHHMSGVIICFPIENYKTKPENKKIKLYPIGVQGYPLGDLHMHTNRWSADIPVLPERSSGPGGRRQAGIEA